MGWVDKRKVGAVAVFIPHDRPDTLIPYATCKRCIRRAARSEKAFKAMSERVDAYLSDQGQEGLDSE